MRFLVLLIVNVLIIHQSIGQCCSPGSPAGGYGNNGTLNRNIVKVYAQYKYSYSGHYKKGDKPYDGDTKDFKRSVKSADYNFVGLGVAWGIAERLTMEVETGYFLNKTQHHTQGILPEHQTGSGFTDLSFLIKPSVYKKNELEFTPTFGMKMPLGKFDKEYKGSILPPDLQPTTGAVNLITGFFLYKGFLKKHLRFFMIARYEFPRTNPLAIKYGNAYLHALFLSYSPSEKITFVLQTRHEYRERDRADYIGGGNYYSSGSQKIFLVPQLVYSLTADWDLSVFSDIPMYQYYNGYQLGNTFAAAIMVSRRMVMKKIQVGHQ